MEKFTAMPTEPGAEQALTSNQNGIFGIPKRLLHYLIPAWLLHLTSSSNTCQIWSRSTLKHHSYPCCRYLHCFGAFVSRFVAIYSILEPSYQVLCICSNVLSFVHVFFFLCMNRYFPLLHYFPNQTVNFEISVQFLHVFNNLILQTFLFLNSR